MGGWTFVGVNFGLLTGLCAPVSIGRCTSLFGLLEEALAVVLILDSAICLFGPRKVFYSTAGLSAILAVIVLFASAANPLSVGALTVGLLGVVSIVSVMAARWEPKVSEQAHPMNLPVFG